jgi:hypothetical protein
LLLLLTVMVMMMPVPLLMLLQQSTVAFQWHIAVVMHAARVTR